MSFRRDSAEDFAKLLSGRSPLRRHVSFLVSPAGANVSPALLRQIRELPFLTCLDATLDAATMNHLRADSAQSLADLRAALPLRLRQLTLRVPDDLDIAVMQLLIDALPVMSTLDSLALEPLQPNFRSVDSGRTAALSLEPLLQLPQLAKLFWNIDDLTRPQLAAIKQLESLRVLSINNGRWSADQLSFLCEPPHRLDQLEVIPMFHVDVGVVHMAALAQLPRMTQLDFVRSVQPDAFRMLPRLPSLQRLTINLIEFARRTGADRSALYSSLRACSALTAVTLHGGKCTDAVGERLLSSIPRLQQLELVFAAVPSLRFLHRAPALTDLKLVDCSHVRSGHILTLGKRVPQLERLHVRHSGRLLDQLEVQALTPPDAIGLPNLQSFVYESNPYVDGEEEQEEAEQQEEEEVEEDEDDHTP
jgi:hypothetical protein